MKELEASTKDLRAFISQICRAYNKGGTARTKIMLSGPVCDSNGAETPLNNPGLVALAAKAAFDGKFDIPGPHDYKLWKGDSKKGEMFCVLYVEVENNWNDLRQTIGDLFHSQQARHKWGVFYHRTPLERKDDVESAVRHVRDTFGDTGFQESHDTHNEILVFPEQLSDESGFRGLQVLSLDFTSGGISEAPITKPESI